MPIPHRVKLHKWVNGVLTWTEHHFSSRFDAEQFAHGADHHVAKVYNNQGNVVKEVVKTPIPADTYA